MYCMSYSLNSLKGPIRGLYMGLYHRGCEGDTRSLDYSSYTHIIWGHSHLPETVLEGGFLKGRFDLLFSIVVTHTVRGYDSL